MIEEQKNLQGKVALVTGGGRGIGQAIAFELAHQGASVVVCSRTESELEQTVDAITKKGSRASYYVADVSDAKQVEKLINSVTKDYNNLDILVTSAGIYGPKGMFHEQDISLWRRALEVNLLGTAYCVHAALPLLMKSKGVVVALAGAGIPKPFPRFSAYSTSKGGVVQFISSLSEEYKGIVRFNSVAPGPVATALIDELILEGPSVVGEDFYKKNIAWKEGKGGVVPPEVAARYIASLCCEDCNVSGRYLSAVWDKDEHGKPKFSDLTDELFTLQRIDNRNYIKKK